MIDIHDISDVIRLHDSIVKEYGGLPGTQDERLLAAALARPFTGLADGKEFFPSVDSKGAVLLQSITQFHPFVDGNKRTAVAVTQIFFLQHDYRWQFTQEEIVEFALQIAAGKITLDGITDWITQRLRKPV